MSIIIPRHVFFTRGVGRHKEKLASFELALRSAGISHFNLVRVSSIFPPHCKIIPRPKGIGLLRSGEVVYCVMADNSSDESGQLVSTSIGLAVPNDHDRYGYLSEHHTHGMTMKQCGDYAEDLAASMLATTLGLSDEDCLNYDEKKKHWRMMKMIVRTTNTTQSAIGKNGLWTTCVAAAVFVP
ncbi:MAG: arginine decarboxylase, pyruvoyl-dependent [Pseudomonadota bacterium]